MHHAFFVCVFQHRHHQAVGRVCGKTDVEVVFEHQLVTVQAGVEVWELLQRSDGGLDQEGQHGDFGARLFVLFVELHAKGFELGDVGVVMVGDVRNHHPVAMQIGTTDFFDATEGLALDGAELGEVDHGPGQQARHGTCACAGNWCLGVLRCCLRCCLRCYLRCRLYGTGQHTFHKTVHINLSDAPLGTCALYFGDRHAQFTCQGTDAGRSMGQRPDFGDRVVSGC